MCHGVGGVFKLSRQKCAGGFPGNFFRFVHCALHSLFALCQHQFRAIRRQQLPPLQAHGFRHGENHPITAGGRHAGKANAGVAAGGFHNDGTGMEQPPFFCVQNHLQAHPVLHAACRVKGFQLGQNGGFQPTVRAEPPQLQQGGVANQFGNAFADHIHDSFRPANRIRLFQMALFFSSRKKPEMASSARAKITDSSCESTPSTACTIFR